MTAILVSARNIEEVQIAMRCGVDIVDLKEPHAGPLGPVQRHIAQEVPPLVGNAARLSIAMGELGDWRKEANDLGPIASFEFVKIGLAGMLERADWRETWRAWKSSIPTGTSAVAVAYVDAHLARSPSVDAVVEEALRNNVRYLLLDTFDKATGRLTDYLPLHQLDRLCLDLTESAVTLAVAGRITREMLPELLALRIPIVALRGAACENGRDSRLSESKLYELVAQVHGD